MEIKNPKSFWDILIWVTVSLTVFFGVEAILVHLFPSWGRIAFIFLVLLFILLQNLPFFKKKVALFPSVLLPWINTTAASSDFFFRLMFDKGKAISWVGWLLPVIIIWQAVRLYREYQKKQEDARKAAELLQEPWALLNRTRTSDSKALILISNARMEEVSLEVDERMILYSLPDGRFLVLFRKPIGLEDFLHALSAFRSEVDHDEDAVGFYGQTFYGVRPDSLQAYVSNFTGTCRTIPMDISTVSLSGAEPV